MASSSRWLRRVLFVAALLAGFLPRPCLSAEAPPEAMGCYFSTGDNDWLWDSPPVQSAADVEAVFTVLQQRFRWGDKGAAVRLTRGPAGAAHVLTGLRVDDRLADEWTRVALRVYRDSDTASFCINWKDSGTNAYPVGVYVTPDGAVMTWSKDAWAPTGLRLPAHAWQRLALDLEPAKGTYTVRLGEELETAGSAPAPLPAGQRYNAIVFSPQEPEGGTVYIDEVSVRVPNPAYRQ
jgi:hypothetical protein